jgi:hypothetical protein
VLRIRLAPYLYDWIDNFGRRSPQNLRVLPEPVVGESFTAALRGRRFGRIVAVEPGDHLTATIIGSVMSYVLVSLDDGQQTRLLLKIVTRGGRLVALLLLVGDLIKARRQLLMSRRSPSGLRQSDGVSPGAYGRACGGSRMSRTHVRRCSAAICARGPIANGIVGSAARKSGRRRDTPFPRACRAHHGAPALARTGGKARLPPAERAAGSPPSPWCPPVQS